MRVGLMQEGHCPPGTTPARRYREMVDEAVLAEDTGWDFYGNGEQHFIKHTATVATPLLHHAFIASRTERIRLRPMSVNLLPYNHPVRIAEDLVTLDVLSNGRAELGGARSNNPWTLEAFGIDPAKTRLYRDESLALIMRAVARKDFAFDGEVFQMPQRSIVQPIQQPGPPVYISATGVASHEAAGRNGIGVMTGNSILGWDYAAECFAAYRFGSETCEPIGDYRLSRLAFSTVGVNCAADRTKAIEGARAVALEFVDVVLKIYSSLSTRSPDYAYLGQIETIRDHVTDLAYLMDRAPYITAGTPDDLIERARRIHEMGADDLILRLDGMGHDANMTAIEMIGRHVIPALHEFREHRGSTPFGQVDKVE